MYQPQIMQKTKLQTAVKVIFVVQSLSCVQLFCSPMDYMQPAKLLCALDFPGKNTAVGCHFLLQGIFLPQELNLCLLPWQADSLPLSHLGSLYIYTYMYVCMYVCMYVEPNYVAIHLKLTQRCKPTILKNQKQNVKYIKYI